jgi:hypothetical protein
MYFVCISWTNKEFDIINVRWNHEEYFTNLWGAITHEVSRAAECVEPYLRQ